MPQNLVVKISLVQHKLTIIPIFFGDVGGDLNFETSSF